MSIRKEICEVLSEFYETLLRDYQDWRALEAIEDFLPKFRMKSELHSGVGDAHKNLNPNICFAKGVIEKLK